MATKNHSRSKTGRRPVASYAGIPKERQQWVRAVVELKKLNAKPGTKITPHQTWQEIQEGERKEQAEKAEHERRALEKENRVIDTDRISCVIQEVQHQLRALVYVARTDALEEECDGEALRTLCENISIRTHVMLDECLKQMGHGWSGNFEDSFADLDRRRHG